MSPPQIRGWNKCMASLVALFNSWKKREVYSRRVTCKQTRESVLRQWPSTTSGAPSGFYLLMVLLHPCAQVSECVEFLFLHLPQWQSWAWVTQHNLGTGTSLHGSWWIWHSLERLPSSWGLCRLWASPSSEASSAAAVWWAAPAASLWQEAGVFLSSSGKQQSSESTWDGDWNTRCYVTSVETRKNVVWVRQSRGLEEDSAVHRGLFLSKAFTPL